MSLLTKTFKICTNKKKYRFHTVIRGLNWKFSSNITSSEYKAMTELLHDQSINIRPADKGSWIVVMDTNKYVDQLENEMISSASYDEVKEDRSKQITIKIKKLKNNMQKRIHYVWVATLSFTYRTIFRKTIQINIILEKPAKMFYPVPTVNTRKKSKMLI